MVKTPFFLQFFHRLFYGVFTVFFWCFHRLFWVKTPERSKMKCDKWGERMVKQLWIGATNNTKGITLLI